MTRKVLDYRVENTLDGFINREVGRRMLENGGIKVIKSDIIAEIAEFCGVGWDNINRVKRGIVTPSLPVALKIAKFFEVSVEEVFVIKED